MDDHGCLIGGRWQAGDGPSFATSNPARPAERIGRYAAPSPAQLDTAMAAAAQAQAAWRRVPQVERAATFGRFLDALAARTEDVARAIVREQGKPLAEARNETTKAIAEGRAMAAFGATELGDVRPSARPGVRNLVTRRPRGIVAAITPWNFPILTPMRKLSPAVVFGNAIVVKPSEFAPAAACIAAEAAAGILPDGLVSIVHGGADVGAALVSHRAVAGVTFTGSVATGRRIYALAAGNLAELSLELGGKNAAVIHDAPDLGAALDQVMGAACMCAGQRCTAISRVIVRRPLLADVLDGLVQRARAYRLGDGMDAATTMGPLTTARQRDHVRALVAAGRAEGASVLAGGADATVEGCDGGHFYAPTVLSDVQPGMRVAREEIFGPVLSVLAYDTLDEAFATLNGVDYGLTASLFSQDARVVARFVDEAETGMLHVNHGTIPDNHMPFGGIKDSGVGAYSVGPSAVQFHTTEHAVYLG
jgi:aldehyde dehydrogenase (NAD+)